MGKVYRFTCIVCPMGCDVEVEVEGKNVTVRGCRCPRGEEWVKEEIFEPKRVLITVLPVENGKEAVVPVKTDAPVPKEKLMELMRYLATLSFKAPIKMGEILVENPLGLGVNIVATREVREK